MIQKKNRFSFLYSRNTLLKISNNRIDEIFFVIYTLVTESSYLCVFGFWIPNSAWHYSLVYSVRETKVYLKHRQHHVDLKQIWGYP